MMQNLNSYINTNLDVKFDRIKKIYKKYLNANNFNNELPTTKFLSDWDPGNNYTKKITNIVKLPPYDNVDANIVKYKNNDLIYDTSKINNLLLRKFNANKKNDINDLNLLFTPDGTSSMLLMFLMLLFHNVKNIAILQPSYYLVEIYCKLFNISYEFIWLDAFDNFSIPLDSIINRNYDAIWITLPLFGTSINFNKNDIFKIQYLINKNIYCIFDESIYEYEKELILHLSITDKTFFIYSPHKSISLNGKNIKFSTIISKNNSIEDISSYQIFYPNIILDAQNCIGIKHFLYPNYNSCYICFKDYFDKNLSYIKSLVSRYNNVFISNNFSYTCYITIYIMKHYDNIYKLVDDIAQYTGYMIIPSDRHYYRNECYFSFRINLLLDTDELINGLTKIFNFLML